MVIQLLVLAGVALFLILRLRSVLGTREGFEKPPVPMPRTADPESGFEKEPFDSGPDRDIVDHVPEGSRAARSLEAMKRAEPSFGVTDFLGGARGAYEMILMGFENGELDEIRGFLSDEVAESFDAAISARKAQGLRVEAEFVGLRELVLQDAEFNELTGEAELRVRFVGELTSVVRDQAGEIVEGNPNEIKRQRDIWTFGRHMGSDDPNWQLVATGQ